MRAHVINLTAFSLHVIIIFFSNAGMSGNNPQKYIFPKFTTTIGSITYCRFVYNELFVNGHYYTDTN